MSTEKREAASEAAPEGHVRRRRTLVGVVKSDKMNKTRVVTVTRRYSHPKYRKFVTRRKNYKVHDETNQTRTGDRVLIIESRPLSRDKRWRLGKLLSRASEI